MTESQMIALASAIPFGTPVMVCYDAGRPSRPAQLAAVQANAFAKMMPPNVYFGTYQGMFQTGNGVVLRIFALNRGAAGEMRTFNPRVGTLHSVVSAAAMTAMMASMVPASLAMAPMATAA